MDVSFQNRKKEGRDFTLDPGGTATVLHAGDQVRSGSDLVLTWFNCNWHGSIRRPSQS